MLEALRRYRVRFVALVHVEKVAESGNQGKYPCHHCFRVLCLENNGEPTGKVDHCPEHVEQKEKKCAGQQGLRRRKTFGKKYVEARQPVGKRYEHQ